MKNLAVVFKHPYLDNSKTEMFSLLFNLVLNDDNCEDSILTFQEYMLSLEANNKGFAVTLLKSVEMVRLTGCMWQTAIMRDKLVWFVREWFVVKELKLTRLW